MTIFSEVLITFLALAAWVTKIFFSYQAVFFAPLKTTTAEKKLGKL